MVILSRWFFSLDGQQHEGFGTCEHTHTHTEDMLMRKPLYPKHQRALAEMKCFLPQQDMIKTNTQWNVLGIEERIVGDGIRTEDR